MNGQAVHATHTCSSNRQENTGTAIAPYVSVHDPAYARALFLDDGSTQLVILVVDVTAIPSPGNFLPAGQRAIELRH